MSFLNYNIKYITKSGSVKETRDGTDETAEGETRTQAKRSLNDIVEAANCVRRKNFGESKASNIRGELEVESLPDNMPRLMNVTQAIFTSYSAMQPMQDKGKAVMNMNEEHAGQKIPKNK